MTCLGLYDSERLVDLVRRVRWCMVLERQMEGATKVSCSGFGDVIIENIGKS